MISKKILIFVSFSLAVLYHFILYVDSYGPPLGNSIANGNSFFALGSCAIMIFIYFTTKWRLDLKGKNILLLYDLFILWIFFSYFRCFFNVYRPFTLKEMILSPYIGLSLFPVLFFIMGINKRYFFMFNRLLYLYIILAFIVSIPLAGYFEIQFFLLFPLFYIIVTFPMQTPRDRIITLVITVVVFITSMTNRAGILRISISYAIVIIYYLVIRLKINRKLINVIVFLVLMTPFYMLYLGLNGKDVFKMILGENLEQGYRQENMRSDTRTFLYVDVFRDIKINDAYVAGKGINAGYASWDFETFNRLSVEVGFLQILLKTGIVGFLLYMSLIITAIFKAINTSNNLFLRYLGMLLSGYVLMFFIENMILFNLFNIIIWTVVGMCHSSELRNMNDEEIKELFTGVAAKVSTEVSVQKQKLQAL